MEIKIERIFSTRSGKIIISEGKKYFLHKKNLGIRVRYPGADVYSILNDAIGGRYFTPSPIDILKVGEKLINVKFFSESSNSIIAEWDRDFMYYSAVYYESGFYVKGIKPIFKLESHSAEKSIGLYTAEAEKNVVKVSNTPNWYKNVPELQGYVK